MDIVCTLFEKHYDYGVGALCNSLVASKFNGLIIIGYKKKLPFWYTQLSYISKDLYQLTKDVQIKFINLDHINYHLGYFKATFLLDCINFYPNFKAIYYFDPDICLKANWNFFQQWVSNGAALCVDNCFTYIHENHPWRKEWKNLFPLKETLNISTYYINSGFIGVNSKQTELLRLWQEAVLAYQKAGKNMMDFDKEFISGLKGDQDLLNAALMYFEHDYTSIIGKEAMGFEDPKYIMGHSVSSIKPWKKNFLSAFFKTGLAPTFAEKLYFKHIESPIKLFGDFKLNLKLLNLKFSILFNRLF
jgi:hypothetical protein